MKQPVGYYLADWVFNGRTIQFVLLDYEENYIWFFFILNVDYHCNYNAIFNFSRLQPYR